MTSKFPFTPSIPVEPWTCHIPEEDLERMNTLIRLTRLPKRTYESSGVVPDLGISHKWMEKAINRFKGGYDWRTTEQRINGFDNYMAKVQHQGYDYHVHFIGMFSAKKDAVPLIAMHGWPGSFMEFLPLLDYLRKTYTPETLPVHLIIPSLIGFGFSSAYPDTVNFSTYDSACINDTLMRGLGFQEYAAQGGDIGHHNARLMKQNFDGCKAVHLNFFPVPPPKGFDISSLDEIDQKMIQRMEIWDSYESSYVMQQALKPSTTGFAIGSNPIALLAWVGEKFTRWSDEIPGIPLDIILDHVSLYYLTDSFPTSLYHYSTNYGKHKSKEAIPGKRLNKPIGYSQFPKEILSSPVSWVKEWGNVVFHRRHEEGGHFAALEQPVGLWEDVVAFLDIAWKKPGKANL